MIRGAVRRADMTGPAHAIEQLSPPVAPADLKGLARLLLDAVESGAAVSPASPDTM